MEPKAKIVSLHGYSSSHDSGFEKVLYDSLSGEYSFECIDLKGHASGRSAPELYPLKDVIAEAVKSIEERADEDTFLIGTSFGAYPILEYLRNYKEVHGVDSKVRGVVLVKPMVDIKHTFSKYKDSLGEARTILNPLEAQKAYEHGRKSQPFDVDVPCLIFGGKYDKIVGGGAFLKRRVRGGLVCFLCLDGDHCFHFQQDFDKVVRETSLFLENHKLHKLKL